MPFLEQDTGTIDTQLAANFINEKGDWSNRYLC